MGNLKTVFYYTQCCQPPHCQPPLGCQPVDGLGRAVRIRLPHPPTSLHICVHSGEGRKLRAKCGVLSARNAPERAGSRRIRPIRRAFSPCEVKTVRFSAEMRSLGGCSPHHRYPISLEWFRDSAVLAGCARAQRSAPGFHLPPARLRQMRAPQTGFGDYRGRESPRCHQGFWSTTLSECRRFVEISGFKARGERCFGRTFIGRKTGATHRVRL